MKLGVIGGAGLLGSTSAFTIAMQGLVDEIILYDQNENAAGNHAIDLNHSVCCISNTKTFTGGFDSLSECDIILNTAGAPERNADSRDVYLDENIQIINEIASQMQTWERIPVVITASNPVDVLNTRFAGIMNTKPEYFIGYSLNDTLRFRWSVSIETGIPASNIDAIVLGEHGAFQVPVFSALRRKDTQEPISLDKDQRARVTGNIRDAFRQLSILGVLRTMGWTSGIGIAAILKNMLDVSDEIVPCSVTANGSYGINNVSLGLPVRLGPNGVREIVEIPLADDELAALVAAADKIRGLAEKHS